MGVMAEKFDEDAKAELTRHSAECELGLGQFAEISLTAKIRGMRYSVDMGKEDVILYQIEVRYPDGKLICFADVVSEHIVR